MNVTLPNGKTIRNVPEGTSKDAIMAKAISAGLATQADFGQATEAPPAEAAVSEGVVDGGVDSGAINGQSGDNDLLQEIEAAFQKIPGAPALSEFAAAANRSVFDVVDFLGPDSVNAVLSLAGSEKRMPTLRESLGSEGGFMEEGLPRDVVRAAGEVAPVALGAGTAIRQAASKLPAFTASEGVGAGVLRQAGQGTAAGDIATGSLAGAGQAIGQDVAGEEGAMAGGIILPVTASMAAQTAKSLTTQGAKALLKQSAPTIDGLKSAARTIYKEIDDIGGLIKPERISRLSSDLHSSIRKEGFNKRIHPKVSAALDEFKTISGTPQNVSEIDTLRRVAQSAAKSIEPDEARLGSVMINKIDDFLDSLSSGAFVQGGSKEVGQKFKDARQLWGRARKSELIQESVERARNQATGFENGLRNQFRSILNSKKAKGFSSDELDAMRMVIRGGPAENIAKALGKFGFSEGQASSMMLGSLGVAGGAAVGGPIGGVAVPLIGQVSKNLAQKLTRGNAAYADAVVRAGKSGSSIVKAYLKHTPKTQRSVEELTELLMRPDISLGKMAVKGLPKDQSKLISDAAYFSGLIREKEDTEQ